MAGLDFFAQICYTNNGDVMKRFYIFDLDGTLCGSMRLWRAEADGVDFYDREAVEVVYDNMRGHYRDRISLKDGVIEFLQRARAAGIKMCVASATRRDISEPLLAKTGLLDFMEFYVDCHELGAFKEHPDIYLEAAKRLGAKVEDCVVFEDAEYCAETARKAGFFTVGVYDEVAEEEGDTRAVSDMFIDTWENAELV